MDILAQISRIEGLLSANKIDVAQQEVNRLAQEHPEVAYVPVFRARIALRRDEYAEAEIQAQQAIAIDAEDDFSMYLLSVAQHNLKKYDEALRHIGLAISLAPWQPEYYATKGQQLLQRERYVDAEFVVREGLELDPNHENCLNVLALSLNLQGKRDVATDTIGELLEANPESADVHANAGYLALRTNNMNSAKTHFVEALRLEPDNQWAQSGLAEVIKATNPLYRQFLRFSVWMADIGQKYRWALIIGLLVVIRILPFLVPFYAVLLLWTWFTSPISNAYLFFHPQGKYLVQKEDKVYVLGIFICLLLAISLGISGAVLGHAPFYWTAAGLALTCIPLNGIVDSDKENKSVFIGLAWCAAFVGLGLWASTGASNASSTIIFVAVAYSWVGTRLG
ncbi:MAG: tetratricopeptide repeat protein [Saprospiraceae bacterium]